MEGGPLMCIIPLHLHVNQKYDYDKYIRSTIEGSYLIIIPQANRVDPDQAALTRAA